VSDGLTRKSQDPEMFHQATGSKHGVYEPAGIHKASSGEWEIISFKAKILASNRNVMFAIFIVMLCYI
jgi:hypothetical protein